MNVLGRMRKHKYNFKKKVHKELIIFFKKEEEGSFWKDEVSMKQTFEEKAGLGWSTHSSSCATQGPRSFLKILI